MGSLALPAAGDNVGGGLPIGPLSIRFLGYRHGNEQPTRLLLVVPIHARVQADGRITMDIEELKLLPHPSG